MKKIKLALAIHNHQPVGNFDFVFREAFEKSYLPFFELLEQYSRIRLGQHFTGPLLEWLQEHEPDFLPRLRKLVRSGQIEMISGGFYEPILAVIPERDQLGQIRKMNDFIQEQTAYQANGMWLAERIWEPHLPKIMSQAGMRYVVLDDSHFKGAGLDDSDLYGYYITEQHGHAIALFPIIEKMRYNIPFAPPEATIDFLREAATEDGQRVVVYADDGEKFGIWPNTHKHCYEDGWLKAFFEALQANAGWIELVHPAEAIRQLRPLGKIYLPTASYREMMEWAMPTGAIHEYEEFERILKERELHDRFKVFVKGGFWRNFMAKYPEANHMHKRMLSVSRRLQSLEAASGGTDAFQRAQDLLWAGQCNCPYWHGIFGGLYLNHLRYAIYHRLIQADVLLDQLQKKGMNGKSGWCDFDRFDFDCDGCEEIVVSNPDLWLCFAPQRGGSLLELDFKPGAINLLDTMARREEAYHLRLKHIHDQPAVHADNDAISSIHDIVTMKEEGLEKRLFYDTYRRASFIDHFFTESADVEQLLRNEHEEAGDFVTAEYEAEAMYENEGVVLVMSRRGNVQMAGEQVQVSLQKRYKVDPTGGILSVSYLLQNLSENDCQFVFGPELAFALLAGDAPDRYYHFPSQKLDDRRLCSVGEVAKVKSFSLVDEWLRIRVSVSVDDPATVWRFPVETISQSEAGFERVYQNSVVIPLWRLTLSAGAAWKQQILLTVEVL